MGLNPRTLDLEANTLARDHRDRLSYVTESFPRLWQAFGDIVLSKVRILRWFKVFSKGRELIEEEPSIGRPATSRTEENVARTRNLLRSIRQNDWGRVAFEWHLHPSHFGDEKNLDEYFATSVSLFKEKMRVRHSDWMKIYKRTVSLFYLYTL